MHALENKKTLVNVSLPSLPFISSLKPELNLQPLKNSSGTPTIHISTGTL